MHLPWTWLIFLNALVLDCYAADVLPRWGQAAVTVNDILYIYGGKIDEFNEFSYTSAPNTNDVLMLSLATSFTASSPPWNVVSGHTNSSSQQGPALAWHTASAYNSSQILVFGGIPDVNSDTVLVGDPDSALLLDVWDRLNTIWVIEPSAWANQPTRRIRHSTATIPSGLIFIFGGEKADGSGEAFSDNWVFDPSGPSFTLLPTENGPPDLVGHVSIILPDGRILVFGGYIPSQRVLLLFSTIYVLDTTRTPYTWSTLRVSSGSLPNPRRAFAATLIGPSRILIHGGSDAQLQTTFDDGWILDLSQPEAIWTRADALSSIGPRRDHFAVTSGDNVVIGFGYSQSAPASDPVHVYNVPGSSLVPTFTPRPPTSTPTSTLPPITHSPTRPTTTAVSSGTTPPTASPTIGITPGPHDPDTPAEAEAKKNRITTIAVSTSLAVLAAAGIIVGIWYYRRRQQRKWAQNRFWVIDGEDDENVTPGLPADDDSQMHRNIPLAGSNEGAEGGHGSRAHGWLNTLGIAGLAGLLGTSTVKSQNSREKQERRNMLDDEDNADFSTWYNARRRDGTSGSSWSLMSILGRGRKRKATDSASSTPWREKTDPFSDDVSSLMHTDEEPLSPTRPRARREVSHVSTRSQLSQVSYTDPFSDPVQEELDRRYGSETSYHDEPTTSSGIRMVPPVSNIRTMGLPLDFTAHTLSPLSERTSQSTLALHDSSGSSIARLSTNESLGTPASRTTSKMSHPHEVASGSGGGAVVPPQSPTLLSGLLPAADGSVKRSNSLWARIARKASDASARSTHHPPTREIRDPNPPPRLSMIAEKTTPDSESPASRKSSAGTTGKPGSAGSGSVDRRTSLYRGGAKHGKSKSSVQTVDSEALERIAGQMEVVQRLASETTHSTVSSRTVSIDDQHRGPSPLTDEMVMSPLEMSASPELVGTRHYGRAIEGEPGPSVGETALRAPVPVRPTGPRALSANSLLLSKTSTSSPPSSAGSVTPAPAAFMGRVSAADSSGSRLPDGLPRTSSASPTSGSSGRTAKSGSHIPLPEPPHSASRVDNPGSVAARVRALEEPGRRMSVAGARSPNPTGSRHTVDYGLVPRRSLFIANPDDKRSSVGSSESTVEQ